MLNLIIVKEMKRRLIIQEEAFNQYENDISILKESIKQKKDHVNVSINDLVSIRIDSSSFESDLIRTEEKYTKSYFAIERYKKDIESYEKNNTISDKTKKLIVGRFQQITDNIKHGVEFLDSMIKGIIQAKKNKVVDYR